MPHAPTQARRKVITITLVERYPLVRAALRDILAPERDLRIVAEVATIDEAILRVRDDPTDVLLVDTDAAVATLVPALQHLRRECPASAVIVLGHGRDADDEVFHAIEAGAAAHVADAVGAGALVETIRAVADGEYVIDASVAARPDVAYRVLEAFRSAALNDHLPSDARPLPGFQTLSVRETEILTLISEGLGNKAIATTLEMSPHTVNNSVKSVLRKLAVNNRTRAVLFALRESWIPVPGGPANHAH